MPACQSNQDADILQSASSFSVSAESTFSSEASDAVVSDVPASVASSSESTTVSSQQTVSSNTVTSVPPQSTQQTPSPSSALPVSSVSDESAEISVIMSITGLEGEVLLAPTTVTISENGTVFDALRVCTQTYHIPMTFSGGSRNAYIESIYDLAQFQHGKGSGWIYRVNDDFSIGSVSVSKMRLNHGDRVDWFYTLDLGKDIGADLS